MSPNQAALMLVSGNRTAIRKAQLRRVAAALHRAELRERCITNAPTFERLPEWAQATYLKYADAALRVVEAGNRKR